MKKKFVNVGLGVLAGALAGQVLRSKAVKDLTVQVVAGGLKVKDSIDQGVEKVRENADDIVAEAKIKNLAQEAEKAAENEKTDIEKVAQEYVEKTEAAESKKSEDQAKEDLKTQDK